MFDETFKPSIELLVVDDTPEIRSSMSALLHEIGYSVRTATDGIEALKSIRMDCPHLLLSDLHMPGMSGFELLSVVRRRYPSIKVIAMSGAFRGTEVPPNLFADAFYEKGSGVRSLLRSIEQLAQQNPRPYAPPTLSAPIWIQRVELDSHGRPYATIACPECLRSYQEMISGALTPIREAHCIYCQQTSYFAIDDPVEWGPTMLSRKPSNVRSAPAPK